MTHRLGVVPAHERGGRRRVTGQKKGGKGSKEVRLTQQRVVQAFASSWC